MCLAIGPLCQTDKSALGRLWWRIASQPHRLFLFSAAVHAAIYSALILNSQISFENHVMLSGIFLSYGVIGFSILGLLLTRFPLWFKTSAIHYVSYGASYNFTFIGLILIEIGLIFSTAWSVVGSVFLLISWLIAVKAIHWSYFWGLGSAHGITRLIMLLLYFNVVLLLIGLIVAFLDMPLIFVNMILLAGFAGMFFLVVTSLVLYVRQKQVA